MCIRHPPGGYGNVRYKKRFLLFSFIFWVTSGCQEAPLDEMPWKSLNWVAQELNPPSVKRREFCKLILVNSSAVVEGVEWNKRELHTG